MLESTNRISNYLRYMDLTLFRLDIISSAIYGMKEKKHLNWSTLSFSIFSLPSLVEFAPSPEVCPLFSSAFWFLSVKLIMFEYIFNMRKVFYQFQNLEKE